MRMIRVLLQACALARSAPYAAAKWCDASPLASVYTPEVGKRCLQTRRGRRPKRVGSRQASAPSAEWF